MSLKEQFKSALQTEVGYAPYCDHVADNSFLSLSWAETAYEMEKRGLTPIGVCPSPEYRPQMGYALVYMRGGETGWCHVSDFMMENHWLADLDLLPPPDVLWERNVVAQYLFNHQEETK